MSTTEKYDTVKQNEYGACCPFVEDAVSEKNYDALKLENQLCFPLYACSREVIKQYKPFLDAIDLTYTQYIAMTALWEKKQLTVKQMGDMLYLDSGTLTPLLKKLEAKGFLNRRRSQEDERNVLVTLTQEGEILREKTLFLSGQVMQKMHLTEEEISSLRRILQKLLEEMA